MRWLWCLAAAAVGAIAGGALVKKLWLEKYKTQKAELETAAKERDLLYSWLLLDQRGAYCTTYFTAYGYQNVAIFGMNREGRILAEKLGETAVYGVELDNPSAVHERLTVYRLGDDPLPKADCMVICDMERIEEKTAAAQKEFRGKIVMLKEILEWVQEENNIKFGTVDSRGKQKES